ncbi:MAG: HAD family hydrolase [Spirochaetaceae bacterium]|nr:HAD family hydrolase [Spirochaetaceae bacterium]MDT8298809.1 HAD family hydrolase [Spirochaetaceae bacterium]
MTYQTVVFDLDGTLVDTLPDIAASFNSVLEQEGYPVHPTKVYRKFVGWGLSRTLELALPEPLAMEEFNRILSRIQQAYISDPISRSRLYPGIVELMDTLVEMNIRTVVYTNKDQHIASLIVSGLLNGCPVDRVIGRSVAFPPKPDPSALMAYMAEAPSSSILMVGDSTVDVETSLRANVDFIGAGWGYGSVEELVLAGSRTNFTAPADLHRYLVEKKEVNDDE